MTAENASRKPASDAAASARRTVETERAGLDALLSALDDGLGQELNRAVTCIRAATGRVIVTGMGKSGHVGQKLAATLASTGTPAFFVHPSEASHGDLGMVTRDDVIIALSWSGETAELRSVIDYSRRFRVALIALTSRAASTLATAADIALVLPEAPEACPHGLAPTTSTVMQLAIGDALAIALLEDRGFTAHDFKVFHPGGQLGASLRFAGDIMHVGDELPLGSSGMPMQTAIVSMTEKRFGCLGVTDAGGRLIGILTDGDLRRHMTDDLLARTVGEVMTPSPKTVRADTLASAALEMLNAAKITALFVVDDAGAPVGILHIHDLLRAGVA
ncbi:MAG: KpsF/GutQ family sugar-phosphate isomerase [Rhodobiaceae bacterium]|nr:KpsF/GutQ family sugar-phosphate isomerase [Rhodobiaceae bacterium]MCC0040923.1 KpsF/GutQ family sugar-phosphate isomerase [Rhodobiaceae bacterium]